MIQEIEKIAAAKISVELLQWLKQTVESTTEFAKEQAPLIAQEILKYNVVIHGITSVFLLIVMIISLITLIIGTKGLFKKWDHLSWEGPTMFFGAIGVIVSSQFFFSSLNHFLCASLAPRMFILEYAANLLKR